MGGFRGKQKTSFMKKQWKSALFAVLLSTVLFSCGSGESEKEPSKDSYSLEKAIKELNDHSDEHMERLFEIEPLFRDLEHPELYDNAKAEIEKWDSLWMIRYDKKYDVEGLN